LGNLDLAPEFPLLAIVPDATVSPSGARSALVAGSRARSSVDNTQPQERRNAT